MVRHKSNQWYSFWQTLKEGYDYFELTHLAPDVAVCQKQYVVNVKQPGGSPLGKLDAEGQCPRLERGGVVPFTSAPIASAQPLTQATPVGQGAPQSQAPVPDPMTKMNLMGDEAAHVLPKR